MVRPYALMMLFRLRIWKKPMVLMLLMMSILTIMIKMVILMTIMIVRKIAILLLVLMGLTPHESPGGTILP